MEFTITNINKSINDVMRVLGYIPSYFQNEGEFSLVKKINRNDYPRFHLYIKETSSKKQATSKNLIFSLHLDQKKPSYQKSGSHKHSGEYDGDVIKKEAERIKSLLT